MVRNGSLATVSADAAQDTSMRRTSITEDAEAVSPTSPTDDQFLDDRATKQFHSLMRVINISNDNLQRLRNEACSSFVRDEIKTLEGKLVRLFCRQMSVCTGDLEPDMALWLTVVGLGDENVVKGLLAKDTRLHESAHNVDSIRELMRQLGACTEDSRRLCTALDNVAIYQDRCQKADCGKQPHWQDLHWESWSSQKHHSSASSATSSNSYVCYSDSGVAYSSCRMPSDSSAFTRHSLASVRDNLVRPASDSIAPLRRCSDSTATTTSTVQFESDGGYSTPSSPSFYDAPNSYSNLSVHSVVRGRYSRVRRSNTTCATQTQPRDGSAIVGALCSSAHSLPTTAWTSRTKSDKLSPDSNCGVTSIKSALEFTRAQYSIDHTGLDLTVKPHRVHHHKSIVPKVCCLCNRSIFYGIKCSDCGARYHDACFYQAGASFRSLHPELRPRKGSWISRLFRRSSAETMYLSCDSGLNMPSNSERPSFSSCPSSTGTRGSTSSTPSSAASHFPFFPGAGGSAGVSVAASAFPGSGGNGGPMPEVHSCGVLATASKSAPMATPAFSNLKLQHINRQLEGKESQFSGRSGSVHSLSSAFTASTCTIADVPEESAGHDYSPSMSSSTPQPEKLDVDVESLPSNPPSHAGSSDTDTSSKFSVIGPSSVSSTYSGSFLSGGADDTTLFGSAMSSMIGTNSDGFQAYSPEASGDLGNKLGARISNLSEWEIGMDEIEIVEKCAPGEFGTVYKANWHGECAVRIFHKPLMTQRNVAAFRKEVQVMKKTRHENIALFMAAVVSPPDLAFVTAFIKGKSLFQQIHLEGELMVSDTVRPIARQMVQGMAYLHSRDIVHRNLTSRNVYVDYMGQVVISDFGMRPGLLSCDEKKISARRDKFGVKLRYGYLHYLAPELLRTANVEDCLLKLAFDQSTDVFAFGTIVYECLYGWPCRHGNAYALIYLGGIGKRCPVCPPVTTDLRAMINKAWSFKPASRLNFSYYEDLIVQPLSKFQHQASRTSFPRLSMEANF